MRSIIFKFSLPNIYFFLINVEISWQTREMKIIYDFMAPKLQKLNIIVYVIFILYFTYYYKALKNYKLYLDL